MSDSPRLSRLGFALIKFKIDGESVYLMREDHRWNDVSLIGGHEQPRDNSNLMRAARRELLEEVPAFRSFKNFELSPLTGEVAHGPVFSASANAQMRYTVRFFHVGFGSNPSRILEALSERSPNVLIREQDLRAESTYRVAELVRVLERALEGGLTAVPFSWREDLATSLRAAGSSAWTQRQISFS